MKRRQDTDLLMLDYHSDTAGGGMASTAAAAAAVTADTHQQGYETSSSSDDALSMGPNGYYHPQRTSSRSSSPGYSDTRPSRRYSSTTVRYGDDARYRTDTKTPTRSTFRSGTPSDIPSGRESPTITLQRQPSKRAAANADNRRIAIMEIGSNPIDPLLPDDFFEYFSDGKLARTTMESDQATSYPQSEGHLSSRRGMSESSC